MIKTNDKKKRKLTLSRVAINATNLYVLLKTVFWGILIAEVLYFSVNISDRFIFLHLSGKFQWLTQELGVFLLLFLTIILVVYLYVRSFFSNALRILRSKRFDIFLALTLGMWIDAAWGGFFSAQYEKFVSTLGAQQLLTIISTPFILGILVLGRTIFSRSKITESLFISDHELEKIDDDLLNFKEKVGAFSESVFNGGSQESLVFGIDAPWGIGKSTFVNFCQEYWHENYKDKVVVYKFSPLRYIKNANLLELFIDGLIHAIQEDSFIPEIRPVISRYSRLLKEVSRFSIFGLQIPNFSVDYVAEDALRDLIAVLSRSNKKVIIVIDDLDRINFSEIKNILFVIRKSFVLPNISYVLCYDTENIGTLEAEAPDTEKVSEFLEKFVNMKVSLYLDRKDLVNYVSENFDQVVADKTVDPALVRQAIGGLLDIYKSDEYHKYRPFVGDIRKLKRLINTIVMFKIHGTNFKKTDFDKRDLIHLLLIYIHYPKIFRKIYDTETNGGYGFFSAISEFDNGYPEDKKRSSFRYSDFTYENSESYYEYIKDLPENQRFLLDQVFSVNKRLAVAGVSSSFGMREQVFRITDVPEEIKTSLACFNGDKFTGTGRNLEAYLYLIANLKQPEETSHHKFYTSRRDEIAKGVKSIDEIFRQDHFSPKNGEQMRAKLWRIIVNGAKNLKRETGAIVIKHLLDNIHKYSLLEIEKIGIGLRHDILYFLIRLLNDAGWVDKSGKHVDNTPDNIKEIAEWVFGEERHSGSGVLNYLSQKSRGVLGLHDLILFRLFCSADRGGDIFNLTRAIAQHGDKGAPIEGDIRNIAKEEMREISQKVFHIFKTQYIDKNINIFEEIEKLQLKDLAGEYEEYVKAQIDFDVITKEQIDNEVKATKTRIASFIIYQLGNSMISHGVGCGFYDPSGKEDKQKIREAINNYLFDFCFNAEKNEKNQEYFLDYLLSNYTRVFASESDDGREFVTRVSEFTKALNKSKLVNYWSTHGKTIEGSSISKKEKFIQVGNYNASYKEDLPKLFKALDEFITEEKSKKSDTKGPQEADK